MSTTVAVIGNGSWATALVRLVALNNYSVRWWVRVPADIRHILQYARNPSYLSEAEIPLENTEVTDDLQACIAPANVVLFVVPAAYLSQSLAPLQPADLQDKVVASAIKGIEVESGLTMAQYFEKRMGVMPDRYCCVSGPSHAEEVAVGKTTYLTCASSSTATAQQVAALLHSTSLPTRISNDVFGVEYAAILKNIYAIATGMAIGLGYGDNFVSVLVSACLYEMQTFLSSLGAVPRQITDSVYMGDLLVTAYSQHSRNRQLGRLVGSGRTPQQALDEMRMVAEGYYACKLVAQQTQATKLPIVHAVYQMLHQNAPPAATLAHLHAHLR